jgi:hypothetical protein
LSVRFATSAPVDVSFTCSPAEPVTVNVLVSRYGIGSPGVNPWMSSTGAATVVTGTATDTGEGSLVFGSVCLAPRVPSPSGRPATVTVQAPRLSAVVVATVEPSFARMSMGAFGTAPVPERIGQT